MVQMKHLEHTLETYAYSHRNMCNITIYFCNIDIKHLKHAFATCSFSTNISLLLQRMEACQHVEVIGVLAGSSELAGNAELGGGA
jgi:uncharacterized membrane protein YGL010W